MSKISFVVPVYNEEKELEKFYELLQNTERDHSLL